LMALNSFGMRSKFMLLAPYYLLSARCLAYVLIC
jgi:hypothetical protein